MPLTAYCKKCAQDVPPQERCPHCGSKLAKSSHRIAWCAEHVPARDWICWNAAMRVLLPVFALVFALVLVLEAAASGLAGVDALLRSGLLFALVCLLGITTAVLLLVLILQGEDLLDCVVDSRGIHIQTYLPNPTPLKLLLRMKPASLMQHYAPEEGILLIRQQELLWKDILRVQLWPEKTLILFYAPTWWLRLALPCTAFTYEDCLGFIQDKLGKKKAIQLPPALRTPPKPKPAPQAPQQEQQLSFADIPPEETPQQAAIPLEDVLKELQDNDET